MASTYSNLKIQLMATGENTGTWGNVTNINLGTAIEEALIGSTDVSFSSADVNLVLSDTNTTQSTRHLRLNLTGTSGGARNLYLSTGANIQKIYIINNGLADAVTVRNKIAGTPSGNSITVPAGKTTWVYNTGTNIVDVVTYLTSLAAGSLALTTPLPVSSGGTGSATATFSGANISALNADSISSGTLAVARGGTGSSTLTFSGANISSLNADSISSGTLAVARGGTGATSLTANSVVIGNGTSAVTFVAPGTNGNVLLSNGTVWSSGSLSSTYALQTTTITASGGLTGGGNLSTNRTISIASTSNGYGTRTVQTVGSGTPTGGSDGDIVYQY